MLCRSQAFGAPFASGPIIVVCFIFGVFVAPNELGDSFINNLNKTRCDSENNSVTDKFGKASAFRMTIRPGKVKFLGYHRFNRKTIEDNFCSKFFWKAASSP